ncbi:MAG: hypothetical protein H6757_01890 [Candidatus Omnitrophica bacterium]|nr:hypothetical protein [Candidatus Omnitrophota bacterium]
MKRTTKFMAILAVMLMLSSSAFAASPWTEADTYGGKVTQKLEFGVKNFLGGWTEIFRAPCCPCPMMKDACPLVKLGKGVVNSVVYTVGGALHLATFPIPVDIPLPHNGVQFD